MSRHLMSRTMILTLCLLAATSVFAQRDLDRSVRDWDGKFVSAAEPIPGQYIVVLKDDAVFAFHERQLPIAVKETARRVTAGYTARVERTYGHALKAFSVRMDEATASRMASDPRIAYIEQDGVMTAFTTQTNAPWGLDRIDQRYLPLSGTFTYWNTGSGVRAYIIDTGIHFSHNDFGGRAVSGFDAIDGGTADDCNGHGTHVAGIVGGTTWGVAKRSTLVAVRVLNCSGSGTTSGVIAGVDWVTANHVKPATANMSLGGAPSASLDAAVSASISAGVSYSVAAGGSQQDACKYSPARVPAAMTIGATDKTDRKASSSNYGKCVDWFAPGVGITSTWHTSNTATATISGTSMAAAHTAGVAALYLQSYPGASAAQLRHALYTKTTKNIVTGASTANNHLLFTDY